MKKMTRAFFKSVVVLIAFAFNINSFAGDYYWVNGAGNWNDPSHWSLVSGGSGGAITPGYSDNVFFDNNSFNTSNEQVFINQNTSVQNISITSSDYFSLFGPNINLSVNGNFIATSAFGSVFNKITFSSDSGTKTINTNNNDIGANISFTTGNWQLAGHLQTTSFKNIEFLGGQFHSNGFSLSANYINANVNPVQLDLTGSYVVAINQLDISQAINIGGSAQFITVENEIYNSQKGGFSNSGSSFDRDQTINITCMFMGNPTGLTVNIVVLQYFGGFNVSCDGVCDGQITITPSGTAGPYSYSINSGPFTSQNVYTGLCQANYVISVKDSSQEIGAGSGVFVNCNTTQLISPPAPLFLDQFAAPTAVSCFGVCDGMAFTDPIGGAGGTYQVNWTTPVGGFQNSPFPNILCAGLNTVQVIDSNGCTLDTSLLVPGPAMIVGTPTITEPTCFGDCDGEVLMAMAGGNGAPYTVSWNPVPTSGQGTNPGQGFCAGSIIVSMFDVDGCQQDTTITMTQPAVLSVTPSVVSQASCFGVCDGAANANPAGGAGNNTFEWFTCLGVSTGITDENPTTLCAGSYFVTVTDQNGLGCSVSSACINITEPTEIDATADAYQVSCFGVCDGAVDVDATGGTPPYTYSWTTVPGGAGAGASDSLSGLCPGQYEVVVTDFNGCNSTADTVEVLEPAAITVSLTQTNPTCYDLCDGTVTATPGGGTPGYSYNWIPAPGLGQGTPTPSNMCDGVYDLTVTDANGCFITDQAILVNPPQFDITTSKTDLLCNGDANGTIDITVNSGGTGAGYTYTWAPVPPIGNGTPNVSGLTSGIWCVTVTDPLACDTTICFNITEPAPLTANASVISQVSCNGDCNGSGQVVIGGGVGPYGVSWMPGGQTSLVASNLCAGNYIVTITDANLCTANDNINIVEPAPFNLTSAQVDITCFGNCNASATVNMIGGGSPPYTYLWNDPLSQTNPTALGLCAGPVTVTVTDQNLCDTIIAFNIAEPAEIIIDTNVINSACFGTCTGAAYITAVGGTGAYNFEWFNVATGLPLGINNDSITNLCPGQYYAEITDAAGCVVQSEIMTIIELPAITTSIVNIVDATCGICDGSADVSAAGGAGGFTFTWSPVPGTGQGTPNVTGLCGGVYSVLVTDLAGCTANISVNVSSVALEVTSMDSTDITCFGLCDGTATINYNVLFPPYVVSWFDNATGLPLGIVDNPASQPSTATGLCAGEYIAVLTNSAGCVTSDTIEVIGPPQITGSVTPTSVTCNGACNGSAIATATGGTGALTYTWGPGLPGSGQGTSSVTGLCAGNWNVTVTDTQGCSIVIPTTIAEPVLLSISSQSSTNISCFGFNDGTATIIHSGGIGPFTYQWIDCNTGLPIGQTSQMATNLGPGSYQVVVTDFNGCTVTSGCLPVVEPPSLTASINSNPVNCFGNCDGQIDVVISGGTAPYFYQWQDAGLVNLPGQTNDTLTNVCQGLYNVTATDFQGCPITFGPIDMTSPTTAWNVTSSQTNVTCAGGCDGIATVTVLGGNNPPYSYLWDDPLNQVTPTATFLCPGTYTVTISDASICDTAITFTIVDAASLSANASITNVACFGDCTGSVTVAPAGGTGTYTVGWSDAQTGVTASGLCFGPITATITDGAGCSIDTTINITQPTELITNTSFFNNATCGVCNGSATVNMIGGVLPYTYDWTPDPAGGDGSNQATGLCPGIVSVLITDANLCSVTEVFGISNVNSEVLTMDSTDVSCFGVCDGSASVTYVCSDPGCTNQWFDGITGAPIAGATGLSITNQCAGTYFVQVTNGSGCIAVASTVITGPTQITDNSIITPITCSAAADAIIDLFPSGGSGAGYTYTWNPVPGNGQGNSQATGVGPGIWCVDITDGSGCVENYCYNITAPSPIIITPTITEPLCNGDCNGIISVTVSGGYGGYIFQWLDGGGAPIGANSSIINGLCAGNYSIQITDAGGCIQTLPFTLSEPNAISAPISSTDALCFGDCSGTATIAPVGGFPGYTQNWFNSTTGLLIGQSGLTASNLCPGDFHAVVTDANGCNFQSATVTIVEPSQLTFVINSNDASCFGVCDGDATITPAGGTPAYIYEWLDITGTPLVGGTNPGVINLCAGNYTVEVTDANGCTIGVQPVVINGFPQITGSTFSNDATCGLSDGNATVNALGGNPPFSYQWYDNVLTPLPGEVNNVLLNAPAGSYFVDVSDANGCTQQFAVNISNLPSTTLTWDAVVHPSCFGGTDGSLAITTTAINPPLIYQWNPGGLIAEDPTGLTAGNWVLQITDAAGCINFYDTTLVDPSQIVVTSTATPTDCGQCNGSIALVVSGGTGVLNVLWNNSQTGTNITGLCSSIYQAQVTDQNGCQVIESVDIPNNGGLTEDVVIQAITCANACDGQATVNGIGGTAPYTYLWLHDNSTAQTQTNLCSGSYFCEITDAAGCIRSIEVVMTDPSAINATALISNPACGASDGSITVTSSAGILPHTYLWNTAATTPSITNLSAGIYTVTITDAAGCSIDFVYGLSNSNAPVTTVTSTDVNCNNICDGTADTLAIIGGTSPFTFDWLDGTGTSTGTITPAINALCAGDYLLETTDNVGCVSYVPITINQPDTVLLNPLFTIDPTCAGICDGEIISNPIGGTLPFAFLWDDPSAQTNSTATGLCTGIFIVDITDANGCNYSQNGTLIEPAPISIITDSIIGATCIESADGEIYITIAGGTPGYTTQWISQTLTDTLSAEDPTGLLPMNYYLTVTDNNGCIFMDTLTVDTLLVLIADAGLDTLLCSGFGTTLTGLSNIDPAGDYTWYDITMTTQLSDTNTLALASTTAGITSFIVQVTLNGCTSVDTVDVTTSSTFTVDAGPDIEMFTQQTLPIGGAPTSAEITHVYDWTPLVFLSDPSVSNPNVIQPTSSNWYYVTVTDTNGCTGLDSMYVTLKPDIIIPDGISPDGNGLNDTWILDFIELYPGVSIDINVYNRWGEPLFHSDETYQDDWGGTTKDGKKLPAGTYYYTIKIDHEDFPKPFTGPITIMW